ncbi:YdcF family protein [Leptolyngbya sp. GGD]|uniref:YdcF family protein n=1 Tax=Leptolyngbya sp. GGD TaxID=2997907 RepID=UPI00227B807E|nr:YdcF family protein [Leptolyngbya sp. GGD]MCY6493548.1 YdcF family protein [Leptolyngbya sp. GGD]
MRGNNLKPSRRAVLLALVGILCCLGSYFPVRLAIARHFAPVPKLILVVGGTPDREQKAAQLAREYPNLDVWVSSGSSEAQQIFTKAGINQSRLYLDNRATDTVSNFTTMVDLLKQQHIPHVFLVTSDFHLARSTAIATVVFGSEGIAFTPVAAYNPYYPPESQLRMVRDVGRALLWLGTGRTGSSLKP